MDRAFRPGWPPVIASLRPTPKDEYKVLVYDGDLITAEQSWKHFTKSGLKSVGVLAVNVRECEAVQLPSCSSPEIHEYHAHIDFTGLTNAQNKTKSAQLLVAANAARLAASGARIHCPGLRIITSALARLASWARVASFLHEPFFDKFAARQRDLMPALAITNPCRSPACRSLRS